MKQKYNWKKQAKKRKQKKNKNKFHLLIQGTSGVYWDIDNLAKEIGWQLALDFARRIIDDRRMFERLHNPFGKGIYERINKNR